MVAPPYDTGTEMGFNSESADPMVDPMAESLAPYDTGGHQRTSEELLAPYDTETETGFNSESAESLDSMEESGFNLESEDSIVDIRFIQLTQLNLTCFYLLIIQFNRYIHSEYNAL